MTCKICNENIKKYKCPKCEIPYCSVKCWKQHQTDECFPLQKIENNQTANETKKEYLFPTSDTVPFDNLEKLKKSSNLKTILKNPALRKIICAIDNLDNPNLAMKTAMMEPLFTEFADECLKIIDPPDV